jgi:chromate reductase
MPAIDQPSIRLVAIVGSLRAKSHNRAIFDAVVELAPEHVTIEEAPIGNLPHYNQDFETTGLPQEVVDFHDRIRDADGVLIFTPEYNYSVPGVLKNALDWGSRPPGKAVWPGKPVVVFGASGGRSGTLRAQLHLRNIIANLGMPQMPKPEYYLAWAGNAIHDGVLTDENERNAVLETLTAYLGWLAQLRQPVAAGS